MTDHLVGQVQTAVSESLDLAENVWNGVGHLLEASFEKSARALIDRSVLPSRIPGHSLVDPEKPAVDLFLAVVFDIRDSTNHLLQAIAGTGASQLQRVYYETSAALPAVERVLADRGGMVTEYLGDGLLGFFRLPETDQGAAIKKAGLAAQDCVEAVETIVNGELARRYKLPPLRAAVGLAASKAIVTVVGSGEFAQPKAIGECVYRASKLANPAKAQNYHELAGQSVILVDAPLHEAWPKTPEGRLKFLRTKVGDIEAYRLTKSM